MQKKNHNWSSKFLAHIPKLLWKTKAQKQKMGLLQVGVVFCKWVFFFCRWVLCECGNFESRSCKQDEKPTTTTKTKLPKNTEKPRSELQEGKTKARE
jgi:hypothetical protein